MINLPSFSNWRVFLSTCLIEVKENNKITCFSAMVPKFWTHTSLVCGKTLLRKTHSKKSPHFFLSRTPPSGSSYTPLWQSLTLWLVELTWTHFISNAIGQLKILISQRQAVIQDYYPLCLSYTVHRNESRICINALYK